MIIILVLSPVRMIVKNVVSIVQTTKTWKSIFSQPISQRKTILNASFVMRNLQIVQIYLSTKQALMPQQ